MQRDPEKTEARLIQRLLSSKTDFFLEIGCGNGRLTEELAGHPDNLIGIDIGMADLSSANRFLGHTASFVLASGESLPFANNAIATVLFTLSLHHQNPYSALKEAFRVLKNKGRILVLEPVADSIVGRLFALFDDESMKYEMAKRAIDEGPLQIVETGAIKPKWVFAGAEEVIQYLFDYFDLETDKEKEREIVAILVDQLGKTPIVLEDRTRFWLLGKSRQ